MIGKLSTTSEHYFKRKLILNFQNQTKKSEILTIYLEFAKSKQSQLINIALKKMTHLFNRKW